MARSIGIITLSGKIGDLTFYQRNGKTFVRKSSSLTAEKVAKDPAFQRTRENNREFAASAKRASEVYHLLGPHILPWKGPRLFAKLTALVNKIHKKGPGERGARSIQFSNYGRLLAGFDFSLSGDRTPDIFSRAQGNIALNRMQAELRWPTLIPNQHLHGPAAATHARLSLMLLTLSDHDYDAAEGNWRPVQTAQHLKFIRQETDFIALTDQPLAGLTLSAVLSASDLLPASVALYLLGGITWFQEVNGEKYPLSTGDSLRFLLHA